MLTLFKTSIKTRNLTLLFTFVCLYLLTGNNPALAFRNQIAPDVKMTANPDKSIIGSPVVTVDNDTVKTAQTHDNQPPVKDDFSRSRDKILNKKIDFQINSDITYLSVNDFVKDDARYAFLEAMQKEQEVAALTAKNDSLRNVYANSSVDRKQELASIILKNESKTIDLNEAIPQLYQQARQIENTYWQKATEDQINRFQEKIKRTKDSLRQVNNLIQQEQHPTVSVPDTIIMTNPDIPVPEPQNTQPTGVVYKIQIAAAKYKLPASAAKLIKKLSIIRQIENYKDEKGVTIYTTGNLKTWKEAVTMQKQVKQEGVKSPVVVAYKDGKKIAVNDARKITNEL